MTTYTLSRGQWILPNTGEHIAQQTLLQRMAQKQVVLLGERHDIAEIHRWQLHTAIYLHSYKPNMMMGFEMFPSSMQATLDLWVDGKLTTAEFLEQVSWDKTWGFPAEIYLPLFHFCRQQNIKMLALNCYRELVTRVGKEGWDAISIEDRDGLTPSAPALKGHKEYLIKITQGRMLDPETNDLPDRFMRAQQTWDRAFACNIHKALNQVKNTINEDPLIVGIMGKGHIEYGYGTPHQLKNLGIKEVGILLSTFDAVHEAEELKHLGDGLCLLDVVEPPAERNKK